MVQIREVGGGGLWVWMEVNEKDHLVTYNVSIIDSLWLLENMPLMISLN